MSEHDVNPPISFPQPEGEMLSCQHCQQLEEHLQHTRAALEKTQLQLRDMQAQVTTQQNLASLGALTAGIAHEIRNPLNFVTNFADLSVELAQELRDALDSAKTHIDGETFADIEDMLMSIEQNLHRVIEHGQRADRIVNGMLQHSRGEPGVRAPTDLNTLLVEYIGLAYHSFRAQDTAFNATIGQDLVPSLGWVDMVSQDMARVFLNLLNNAFDAVYSKQREANQAFDPCLLVWTTDRGARVEIGIRDNGDGIAPDVLEHIFQPFFTTKPPGSGTGLGFSISYDIVVHEHRGELLVDTEVGQYTEFKILLPKHVI